MPLSPDFRRRLEQELAKLPTGAPPLLAAIEALCERLPAAPTAPVDPFHAPPKNITPFSERDLALWLDLPEFADSSAWPLRPDLPEFLKTQRLANRITLLELPATALSTNPALRTAADSWSNDFGLVINLTDASASPRDSDANAAVLTRIERAIKQLRPGVRALRIAVADHPASPATFATAELPLLQLLLDEYGSGTQLWHSPESHESTATAPQHAQRSAVAWQLARPGVAALSLRVLLGIAGAINPDFDWTGATKTGERPGTPAAQFFEVIRRLIGLRVTQLAFHPEAPQTVLEAPGLEGFLRTSRDGRQRIAVIRNPGDQPRAFTPPNFAGGIDLISGNEYETPPELAAGECLWLELA